MAVSSSITLHSISLRFPLNFCVKRISFSVSHVEVGVFGGFSSGCTDERLQT